MKSLNSDDVATRLKEVRSKVIGYDPVPMEMELFDPKSIVNKKKENSPETEIHNNRINLDLFSPINSGIFFFGPFIILTKKIIRKSLKWLLAPLIAQLNTLINAHQSYFDSYEARFKEIDRRFNVINEHFEDFKNRFHILSNTNEIVKTDLAEAKDIIEENNKQLFDKELKISMLESTIKKIQNDLVKSKEDIRLQIIKSADDAAITVSTKFSHIEENINNNQERLAELFEYLSDKVERFINSKTDEIAKISSIANRLDAYNISQRLNRVDRFISSLRINEIDNTNLNMTTHNNNINLESSFTPKFDYYSFTEKFRGSENLIKERQYRYLEFFNQCSNVIDIGCGRGEFLELLKNYQINSYGIDIDPDMVDLCRDKGLKVFHDDAVSHLKTLDNSSIGGIFIAQVIEHLSFEYLMLLIELSMEKLTEGGILLVETLNPESLSSLKYFYMDPSHVKLIPDSTLEYVMESAGFVNIKIQHINNAESTLILNPVQINSTYDEWINDLILSTNANTMKINKLLFGPIDYAIIGQKHSV